MESSNHQLLAFVAADAYCAEMAALEDALGWLFVLRDWQPGTPGGSLFFLLSQVQVGKNPWKETDARELLNSLDFDGFRKLLHIPSDLELEADGFPPDIRAAIATSIGANLDGLKRVADKRLIERRGHVVAFNKLKHLMLALPTAMRGKQEVWIPNWLQKDSDGRAFDLTIDGVHIQSLWLEASVENIRLMVSRAIIGQAILNSLLGLILWTRFGEPYETPAWAANAVNLPGWYDDDDEAELDGPTAEDTR